MTHSIAKGPGRLCNQIIRNIALSILAEKFDLKAEYQSIEYMKDLGIPLFSGLKSYASSQRFREINQFDNINEINYNLVTKGFFQRFPNITYIYNYLQMHKEAIINKNPWKERFSNNKDLFIHVRAGDIDTNIKKFVIEYSYYQHCIGKTKYENIYLATDDKTHEIVQNLITKYPYIKLVDKSPVQTIQFGCTCSNIILSHGSFSAMIGYLAYFSENIYYYNNKPGWCPISLFQEKGFVPINKADLI